MAVIETLLHPFATAKIARDLRRKGRAHNSGPEPRRLRRRHAVLFRVSAASEPAIVATATKAANVFFILASSM